MTTYQATSALSDHHMGESISPGDLGYMRTQTKNMAYNYVIKLFEECELSQVELARRLGKGPDVISRWLGSPGNWTLDTLSDLVLATTGGVTCFTLYQAPESESRNYFGAEWLPNPVAGIDSYTNSTFAVPSEASASTIVPGLIAGTYTP